MEHHHMPAGPEKPIHQHKGLARPEHPDHHSQMIADYRRRFWVSLIITIPILLLSPVIQQFLGLEKTGDFP
jgi:Cu2+-exporting ATPase